MTKVMTLTTPLLRQTVGFDRFNDLFDSMMQTTESFDNYPPYNIEKHGDNDYRVVMAVAGFAMEDLNIVLQDGVLTVSGKHTDAIEDSGPEILHRGIATRAFEKTFRLADHLEVKGAEMRDGLLEVNLVRNVPEEKKPRIIPITRLLEGKKRK